MGLHQHVCAETAFRRFPEAALEGSLVDRFAEQVARHRECLALVDGGVRLTYGELDRWSNGVAHEIVGSAGAGRAPVALILEQGAGYAAAVLGTLKTVRPYVPLEPSDPASRLRMFVRECGASLVLCDEAHRDLAAELAGSVSVACVDDAEPSSVRPAGDAPGPDSIAYVFFTSGTTGAPKGVFDSHRNVLHNVLRYTNALSIAPTDRLTLLQGPAFSGCVSSQFGALLNGAASFPFRLGDEGLVSAAEWLTRERITIYHSVPSIFRAIATHSGVLADLRVVRLEGDRATSADVELWRTHTASSCLLANGLGTTETGLARQLLLGHDDTAGPGVLPVGHPVRDMDVVLVDDDRVAVPDGEVGEIAVASSYLAFGYWHRPDLTAERFESRNGSRTYFTGDLGRLTADGCLEYLGRREGDLKVLGTRVEPAELERELLRVDGVRDAAIAVHEGTRGDGRVVAYLVPSAQPAPDLASVRAALGRSLPAAMLPTSLVVLDSLPLGANGKVERRALPEPPAPVATDGPLDTKQEWLVRVWQEVLGVDALGPNDDFFAFGGDSLAAAEIVARIEEETGRALPLGTLLRAPTIAALAELLDAGPPPGSSSLTVLRDGDAPPLVLVHGNNGTTLHYAYLTRRLGSPRALWALDYTGDDLRVEAMAAQHVQTIVEAQPEGPYTLVGFCYGAVVAHAIALQLTEQGQAVELLGLLGVTPLEFPTLVPESTTAYWNAVYGPNRSFRTQVRHHLRHAFRLSTADCARYVVRRATNLLLRPVRRGADELPEIQRALLEHEPRPFPGRALVVLHALDASEYTSDPQRDWAALAETVDVAVVPGRDHDMLEEPGVAVLAELLGREVASSSDSARGVVPAAP